VSPDGTLLYYVKADRAGLWRAPVEDANASERLLIEDLQPVDWNNWAVLAKAIYYTRRPVPDRPEMARFDLATGETKHIQPLPDLLYKSGLWVALDESYALFTRIGTEEADLMMLELNVASD
jgi:hypothetical protein